MLRRLLEAIRNHKARRTTDTIMRLMETEKFMQTFVDTVHIAVENIMPSAFELASNVTVSDVASEMDYDVLADYFETAKIAEYISVPNVADNVCIDYEDLVRAIDMDEVKQDLVQIAMSDLQREKEDLIHQVIDEINFRLGGGE